MKQSSFAQNIIMDGKKQIDKTAEELSQAERDILEEHTTKIATQLNHYINLKKKKLYLKKKLKHAQIDEIKSELSDKNTSN